VPVLRKLKGFHQFQRYPKATGSNNLYKISEKKAS
jgi:hypothetical protein